MCPYVKNFKLQRPIYIDTYRNMRDKQTEIFKILKMRQCVKNFKLQRPIYTDTYRNMRDKESEIFKILKI